MIVTNEDPPNAHQAQHRPVQAKEEEEEEEEEVVVVALFVIQSQMKIRPKGGGEGCFYSCLSPMRIRPTRIRRNTDPFKPQVR